MLRSTRRVRTLDSSTTRRGFLKSLLALAAAPSVAIAGPKIWLPEQARTPEVDIVRGIVRSTQRIHGLLVDRDIASILTPAHVTEAAFGFPFMVITDMQPAPRHFRGRALFQFIGTVEELKQKYGARVIGAWESPDDICYLQLRN